VTTAHDVADALYGQPPQGFTAARDAQVAAARTAGEKTLAAELAALKRPSQSAWLVNLLALRRPDTIERLVALGQTIREAQGSVTPQQLRDLSAQRRSALDGALALAGSLAVAAGEPAPSRAQLAEVEGTLAASMADPEAAAVVGAGRVLKALVYSGFGGPTGSASGVASLAAGKTTARAPGPGAGTHAVTGTGEGKAAATAAERERAQRAALAAEAEAAKARLAAATDRVEQARRAHAGALGAERELQAQAEALTAEIAAASARLDALHRDGRAARQARLAAERDLASAQRRLERLAEPS
jgi:hypothetical protein